MSCMELKGTALLDDSAGFFFLLAILGSVCLRGCLSLQPQSWEEALNLLLLPSFVMHWALSNLSKYEICDSIILAMAESKLVQLNFENNGYSVYSIIFMYSVYAKPWPHSDIRSCCCQFLYAFTSRYDSTLLGLVFYTAKVFLHEI